MVNPKAGQNKPTPSLLDLTVTQHGNWKNAKLLGEAESAKSTASLLTEPLQ